MTFTEFFKKHNLVLPIKITKESKFKEKEISPESDFYPFNLLDNCLGYWTEDESPYMHRPMTRWCIALTKKRRLIDLFSEPNGLTISIKSCSTFYELLFETPEIAMRFVQTICSNKIDGEEYMRIYHNIPIGGFKYDENNPILVGQLWIPGKQNKVSDRPKIKINSIDNGINATLLYSNGSTAGLIVPDRTIAQFQYTDLNGKKYKLEK